MGATAAVSSTHLRHRLRLYGLLQFAGPLQSLLRETFGWEYGDYYFPNVRSLGGAATVITLVLYPYVYLLARASFLEQSVCVLDVGRTLGRGPGSCSPASLCHWHARRWWVGYRWY